MRPPNLVIRGLILLGFPLLCQLGFVITLGMFLSQVQSELAAQTDSREIISSATKLSSDMVRFIFSFSGEHEIDSGVSQKTGQFEAIDREIVHLLTALSARSVSLPRLTRFESATIQLRQFFRRWQAEQNRGRDSWLQARASIDAEAKTRVKEFAIALDETIEAEESRYDELAAEKEDTKTLIKALFAVAIVSSLLSTVLLTYLYALFLSRPISRLKINSILLSQGKELLPAVVSGDEFEALDLMLRRLATALESAASSEASMLENAQDLVCVLDRNCNFTDLNGYSQVLLSCSAEELIGQSLGTIVSTESFEIFRAELKAVEAGSAFNCDLTLRAKDGALRETRWRCYCSSLENSLFCVVGDISEQRRLDMLKADFTEILTDDLRQPLELIRLTIDKLSKPLGQPLPPKVEAQLQAMVRNLEKLIALVNDLLSNKNVGDGALALQFDQFEVQAFLSDAVSMLQALAEVKPVLLELKPCVAIAFGDRGKLSEVVVNFIGNAIKFAPAHSVVSISCTSNADSIEIMVTDSGPGISLQMQNAIFQAFEQVPGSSVASSTGAGVGLGLAICKQIVEAHGGRVGVRSAEPTGSTFWFTLPKPSSI